jgi:hypothetical protein
LIIFALVFGTALTNTNYGTAFSQSKNPVLDQAQKSLDAKFNSSPVGSPPVFQEIKGSSTVKDVWFTWVIISSDKEVSVNLRYVGDGSPPPVSLTADALTPQGKMRGDTVLESGWISPSTMEIAMNGDSSLYDAYSISVVGSASGSPTIPPPQISPPPSTSPPVAEQPTETNKPTTTIKPQGGTLKVLSSSSFVDSIGFYHIVGEIQNGTPDSVTFVQVSATFYDKNNNVVGTSFTYTNPRDLSAGDKAPFEIILTSSSIPAKQIKHYRVTVSHD